MNNMWIKGLRSILEIFFVAMTAGGVIGGIITGFAIEGFAGFLCFIGISLGVFLFAFLSVAMFIIFIDMAEDVSAIAGTTRKRSEPDSSSTRGTAPMVLDTLSITKKKAYEQEVLQKGGWKCNSCGKVNSIHTGTCGCGNDRY